MKIHCMRVILEGKQRALPAWSSRQEVTRAASISADRKLACRKRLTHISVSAPRRTITIPRNAKAGQMPGFRCSTETDQTLARS
ncbi:hypothetical protein D3C81_987150 [compost metagenome]